MNLLKRFLTALVLGPIIILLLWGFNPYGFYGFALLALFIGLWEYGSIVLPKDHRVEKIAILLLGSLFSLFIFAGLLRARGVPWVPTLPSTELILAFILIALALLYLFRPKDLASAPSRLGLSFFGVIYCGLLFTYVAGVSTLKAGPAWVTMLLTISWFNDTGGYFAGRFLGGKIFSKKLYPLMSPKKTWEGFFGGLLGSFLAALLAKLWYFPLGYAYAGFGETSGPNLTLLDCALIALPAGVIGVAGDLVESLFKRAFGVKDSGTILPGHGGMLDRVDALLFAAPYVYFYGRYLFDT